MAILLLLCRKEPGPSKFTVFTAAATAVAMEPDPIVEVFDIDAEIKSGPIIMELHNIIGTERVHLGKTGLICRPRLEYSLSTNKTFCISCHLFMLSLSLLQLEAMLLL